MTITVEVTGQELDILARVRALRDGMPDGVTRITRIVIERSCQAGALRVDCEMEYAPQLVHLDGLVLDPDHTRRNND